MFASLHLQSHEALQGLPVGNAKLVAKNETPLGLSFTVTNRWAWEGKEAYDTKLDNLRALAGGQTLINVMKARAASPDVLVDLNDIAELKGIELGADGTWHDGLLMDMLAGELR